LLTLAKEQNLLSRIRQLGSYDSIVYCKYSGKERAPENGVRPIETFEKAEKRVFMIPIKDINSDSSITFEDVNPFTRKTKSKKKVFVNRFYPLHVLSQEQGKNWTIYELE